MTYPRGRPPLRVGTYGKISCKIDPKTGRYKARARFRDLDGESRPVARFGDTKGRATDALKEALRDRQQAAAHLGLSPQSTMGELADKWLASDEVRALSPNSLDAYKSAVKNHVKPKLGGIRLSEFGIRLVNTTLTNVRKTAGPSMARTTKTVLRQMCQYAVGLEAMPANPVREAAKIKGSGERKGRRTLTTPEWENLSDLTRADARAVAFDLPDLIEWLDGTGCRIGEALACRDAVNQDGLPLLDLEHKTWEINATLIRVGGVRRLRALEAKTTRTWEEDEERKAMRTHAPGLRIQERTKSDAGWRIIVLPQRLVDLAKRRQDELRFRPDVPVLFPSPRAATLRDVRNTEREWLEVRRRLGYEWLNFHKFRSTVATRLLAREDAEVAKVAEHMGHSRPSMTLDYYAGRKVTLAAAGEILDR